MAILEFEKKSVRCRADELTDKLQRIHEKSLSEKVEDFFHEERVQVVEGAFHDMLIMRLFIVDFDEVEADFRRSLFYLLEKWLAFQLVSVEAVVRGG